MMPSIAIRSRRPVPFRAALLLTLALGQALLVGPARAADPVRSQELVSQGLAASTVDQKLALFQQAVEADPANVQALNNLGSMYQEKGDLAQARRWYEEAVRQAELQGKSYPIGYFSLGDACYAQKRYQRAWQAYQKGLALAPDDQETLARVEEMRRQFATYFDSQGNFLLKDPEEITRGLKLGTRNMVVGEEPSVDLVVEFEYDSDEITAASDQQVENLAAALKEMLDAGTGETLTLAGHTDERGAVAYNLDLSRRRAEAVKRRLVKDYALSPDRLATKGYGKSHPKVPKATSEDDHRRNRRVEIIRGAGPP